MNLVGIDIDIKYFWINKMKTQNPAAWLLLKLNTRLIAMQAEVADNRTPVIPRQQKELENDDLDLDERTYGAVVIHVTIIVMRARDCDILVLRPVVQ